MTLVAGPDQAEEQSQIIDEVLVEPSTTNVDGIIGTRLLSDTDTPAADHVEQQSQNTDEDLF